MIKAYIDFWKRAFDFRGRSTRPDFWWTYLVNVIIMTILVVFCILIPLFSNVDFNDPALLNNPAELRQLIMGYAWPVMLFGLIELIPQLSLQTRRLRDAGFHPAWVLLSCMGFIPIVALFSIFGLLVNCSGLMKIYNLERTKLVLSFLMFKAMRILVLKLSKFRKPKAFRLMTLMRLLVASSFAFE